MIPPVERLIDELSVFADLGTDAPQAAEEADRVIVHLIRNGTSLILKFDTRTGAVVECMNDQEIPRASYRALLAGETFANLRAWASAQQQVLRTTIDEQALLPFTGTLSTDRSDNGRDANVLMASEFLKGNVRHEQSVRVLLIDGPAGIGKTRLIELLAYQRARDYSRQRDALLLHVKSRGRVLTFLQDLMAFSLQNMRLQVTYDQIPVLVRHGLIQLAIDGFDELGDPNGYDVAWAQVRDLVNDIEGMGTLILAGRETFIGRERLLKAVPRLDAPRHSIGVLTLQTVPPNIARNWLAKRGWGNDQFQAADEWDLLDAESYALRPFFLAQLADLGRERPDYFRSKPPLITLIERMIDREATKFPDATAAALKGKAGTEVVFEVLGEVARDVAENQSDTIDEDSLIWIVDTVLGDGFDPGIGRMLKNRISAVAFLQPDERKGHRRFSHSEFFNYFLAHAAFAAICRNEVPKFIRRMILGTDFLLTFAMVLASLDKSKVTTFIDSVLKLLANASALDRGGRNLGALLFAALSNRAFDGKEIANVDIDDAVIRDITAAVKLTHCTVNQLDVREADLSKIIFDDVVIGTAITDETTRLPASFPDVSYLQVHSFGGEQTLFGVDAQTWLNCHGRRPSKNGAATIIPETLAKHELVLLMQRVCRVMMRQHWIRSDGDDHATALIEHPLWGELKVLLADNGLLEQRNNLAVSGRPSAFFHVKYARQILLEELDSPNIEPFLRAVVKRANEIPS